MRRLKFVLAAALLLVMSIASTGCAASVDGYQAGMSRESYAAGVDALATARAGGQINDSLAMDCEAARLIVVTAIDVQDPEHMVITEAPDQMRLLSRGESSALPYVRTIISAMRASNAITHGVTATAKAQGRTLSTEDFAEIMRRQSAAEKRWLALLPAIN